MALSGSFQTTILNGYRLRLDWSATQSTINNTSTITTNLYWISLGSSWTVSSTATKTGSTTIAGETFGFSGAGLASLSGNQTKLIHTAVKTVSHDANGYLTTSLSAIFNIALTLSGTYYASISIPNSAIELNRILRLSYPSLSPNPVTMGGDMVITSNRVSADYLHKYYYSFGGIGKTLISGGTNVNNFTWTTDLATLANQVPNATSGTGVIYCETYSGATLLGESQTSFTAVVPASAIPTQTSVTVAELTAGVQTLLGNTDYFIQGVSNIRTTINGASGIYGSTISNYYRTLFGVEYENATNVYDSGVISASGTHSITARVKDSRGRFSNSVTTTSKTIIPYSIPIVNSFSVQRCLSNGTLDDLGEYVKIVRSGSASALQVASVEKNRISAKVYYRVKGDEPWTEITTSNPSGIKVTDSSDLANGVTTTEYVVGNGDTFAVTNVYEFKFEVIDKLNTTTSNIEPVAIGSTVMSLSDVGVGIGKVWQDGALDVKGESNFEGDINQIGNLTVNNKTINNIIPNETYLALCDISIFHITTTTTLTNSYPQILPLTKSTGELVLNSNVITLPKGYLYEIILNFRGYGTGLASLVAQDTSGIRVGITSDQTICSITAPYGESEAKGFGIADLTIASIDTSLRIANQYMINGFTVYGGSNSGNLIIKKFKKITV
jgi:hypothetical protein